MLHRGVHYVSKKIKERFQAIADEIEKRQYDIVALQEVGNVVCRYVLDKETYRKCLEVYCVNVCSLKPHLEVFNSNHVASEKPLW